MLNGRKFKKFSAFGRGFLKFSAFGRQKSKIFGQNVRVLPYVFLEFLKFSVDDPFFSKFFGRDPKKIGRNGLKSNITVHK